MVQISISTIILAVLACVGSTLAAPIPSDFSDHKFYMGTVAHPVAPSLSRRDVNVPVFERAISEDYEVNGRRHHKRGLLGTVKDKAQTAKDKAQTAKDKAHRDQDHLDSKLLHDAKDLGRKSKNAVNRRRDFNALETREQGEGRRHWHNHGAPAHPAIPAPSRRDINDFVFEREIGDKEDSQRRHDTRGLLHTLEHKGQDAKKNAQKNQDHVNDTLLTDTKKLGKKAKKALDRRRMSARDFDEDLRS